MEDHSSAVHAADRSAVGSGNVMLTVVGTMVGNLGLLVACLLFGFLALIASWIPPRGNWVPPVSSAWGRCLLWSSGARLRVRFEAQLDHRRHYVFMANHESLLDIPVMAIGVPVQYRFLAKRSLFQIPIFGWAMKSAGFVSVDRENRQRAGKAFSSALGALRQGASLVVFPEETRSAPGELLDFQRGGFLMALKAGLAIVPVGIAGTGRVRSKGSWIVRPGPVEVRFGRPIEVTEYGLKRKDELIDDVAREVARLAGIDADCGR